MHVCMSHVQQPGRARSICSTAATYSAPRLRARLRQVSSAWRVTLEGMHIGLALLLVPRNTALHARPAVPC